MPKQVSGDTVGVIAKEEEEQKEEGDQDQAVQGELPGEAPGPDDAVLGCHLHPPEPHLDRQFIPTA